MLRNIASITSACLMLIASFFLIRDILKLSPKIIIGISLQKFKNSKKIIIELSKQNANYKIGFILLVFALFCQLYTLTTYPKIEQMGPPEFKSIFISIIISIIVLILSLFISNYIHQNTIKKIDNITKNIH